jgi:hypothetical protein
VTFGNLVYRTFLPEIEELRELKARALGAYREGYPGRDPFADRSLEVLCRVAIDVQARPAESTR